MFGTIVNTVAIVAAGLIGVFIKKGIPKNVEKAVLSMQGLAIIIIGLNGILGAMLTVDLTTGRIKDSGGLLLLISLVIGVIIGEIIGIDKMLGGIGDYVEKKIGSEGFSKGFISATIIFCVGAMAIIGALNDGLKGDSSVLIIKSTLDFVCGLILASSLGIGVAFSAIPVFLYQGAISMGAGMLAPVLTGQLLDWISMVGYAIVASIGINFLFNTKIKTANLLPAMLIPVVYNLLLLVKNL